MSDLDTALEIMKQVNTALFTLKEMGLKVTGVIDIPILLKAFKIIS